eukprot:GHVO01004407.1.p1 GENE.GHVO01004407.1~~GHVO01004407.1.p1  ORF type:complete len:287 (+),score=32.37 GHVO01004407.1:527-1387(+)
MGITSEDVEGLADLLKPSKESSELVQTAASSLRAAMETKGVHARGHATFVVGRTDIDIHVWGSLVVYFECANPSQRLHKIRDILRNASFSISLKSATLVKAHSDAKCVMLVFESGFRLLVYAATKLSEKLEEQRQLVIRKLTEAYESNQDMLGWKPALSEAICNLMCDEHKDIHRLMKVCKAWAASRNLPLTQEAAEQLAYVIAKEEEKKGVAKMEQSFGLCFWRLDLVKSMQAFFSALKDPKSLLDLCQVLPPANYVWPWDGVKEPVLIDAVNPYRNIVANISGP